MRTAWHDIWGGASGAARNLSPRARIVCGGCVFAACIAAPAASAAGTAFIAAAVSLWLAFVRPPVRVARGALLFGLVLFLPYFLLAPVIGMQGAAGWRDALAPPWAVFIRGLAAMQVSISTLSALTASDLRKGLLGLPIPEVLSAVLIQIVHQSAVLFYETRRIASAIAVRGGTSGVGTGIRLVGSLPRVWLPRVLDRVDRVATAMEMRGYASFDLAGMDDGGKGAGDVPAIAAAALLLAASLALRILGGG